MCIYKESHQHPEVVKIGFVRIRTYTFFHFLDSVFVLLLMVKSNTSFLSPLDSNNLIVPLVLSSSFVALFTTCTSLAFWSYQSLRYLGSLVQSLYPCSPTYFPSFFKHQYWLLHSSSWNDTSFKWFTFTSQCNAYDSLYTDNAFRYIQGQLGPLMQSPYPSLVDYSLHEYN